MPIFLVEVTASSKLCIVIKQYHSSYSSGKVSLKCKSKSNPCYAYDQAELILNHVVWRCDDIIPVNTYSTRSTNL